MTLAALAAPLSARAADAVDRPDCEDGRLRVVGQPEERWLVPLAHACSTLAAMPNRDRTARVRIVPAGGDLALLVTLADGRSATRLVRDTDGLLPTLEALVALPPAPAPAAAGVMGEPAVVPATPALVPAAPGPPVAPRPPAAAFDVEVGAVAGARVAGPGMYLSGAPSIFAQARVARWLVGLGLRWDTLLKFTGAAPEGFEADAIALTVMVARRIPTRLGNADFGFSPRLVVESLASLHEGQEVTGTSTDIRPGGFVRFVFGQKHLHFMIEADAEISPTRLRREIHALPDAPKSPGWSSGIAMGLLWDAS